MVVHVRNAPPCTVVCTPQCRGPCVPMCPAPHSKASGLITGENRKHCLLSLEFNILQPVLAAYAERGDQRLAKLVQEWVERTLDHNEHCNDCTHPPTDPLSRHLCHPSGPGAVCHKRWRPKPKSAQTPQHRSTAKRNLWKGICEDVARELASSRQRQITGGLPDVCHASPFSGPPNRPYNPRIAKKNGKQYMKSCSKHCQRGWHYLLPNKCCHICVTT